MTISSESRYKYCDVITNVDGGGTLIEPVQYGLRPFLAQTNFPDNSSFNVANTTLHKLAWKAYGNSDYFWVIADFSNIVDPFSDLIPENMSYYTGSLLADLPAGTLTSFKTSSAADFNKNDSITITDLATGNTVKAMVVSIQAAANTVVTFPTAVSGFIAAATSVITRVVQAPINVIVPTMNRTQFNALEFGNPLNTLGVD